MRLPSMTHVRWPRADEKDRLIVLLAVVVCIFSTAAIIANIEAVPFGSGPSFHLFLSQISSFLLPSVAALWFIALMLLLFRRRQKLRIRKKANRDSNQASMIGIFVFLTILVALAAISGSGDYLDTDTRDAQGNDNQTDGMAEPQSSYFSTPESFLSLVPFIIILALVFFLALWHIRAERTFVAAKEPPTSEVTTLNKAIDILDKERDARSGILRIYAEMCALVSDPEVEIPLTPRELERLVTEQLKWPKRPVHQLTEVFQEARYSDHPMQEEEKLVALESLSELKATLEERAHAQ